MGALFPLPGPSRVAVLFTVGLVLGACSDPVVSTTATSTTAVPELVSDSAATLHTTTSTTSTTSTTVLPTEPVVLTVGADGFYPWLFPSPTLSWYEDGCREPEVVANDFVANFFEQEPVLTAFGQPGDTVERRFLVHSRGEGGSVRETGTELTLEVADVGVVDCDAWVVTGATSPEVQIDSVTFADNGAGSAHLEVSGAGFGFEGVVDLRAHDESFGPVASGFALGGPSEPEPFVGLVAFTDEPLDSNLLVVASPGTTADGAQPAFAAYKAQCCGEFEVLVADTDWTPAAVVGVTASYNLHIRTGPGFEQPIVAEVPPFTVGMELRAQTRQRIGEDDWVEVRFGEVFGWANEAYLTDVEVAAGGDAEVDAGAPDADLLRAASDVREALSMASPPGRLADILEEQGAESILVSTEAYIADDDQLLSVEDLRAAGSNADSVRLWGYTDGKGDPIEATIAEFFGAYPESSVLVDLERVGVDTRFRSSNTTDNLIERFPNATVVELHSSGDDEFAWRTLRLAFDRQDSTYRLVAIVSDSWTI